MMWIFMIMFKKITIIVKCQFRQMEIHNLDDDSWTEWKEF